MEVADAEEMRKEVASMLGPVIAIPRVLARSNGSFTDRVSGASWLSVKSPSATGRGVVMGALAGREAALLAPGKRGTGEGALREDSFFDIIIFDKKETRERKNS